MILGSVGIAFVIAFIYMVLLRYCSGLITWLSIIIFFAGMIALAILLLQKGKEKEDDVNLKSRQIIFHFNFIIKKYIGSSR